MNWPKVKTILIVVLVAVNVFLFAMYINTALRLSRNQAQVKHEVCSLMADMGYQISPQILPDDTQVYYPARITRNTQSERDAMSATFGNVSVENTIGASKYIGSNGEIVLRGGGYIEASFSINQAQTGDAEKIATSKLKSMKVDIQTSNIYEDGDARVVSGVCLSGGLPIFNCKLDCVLRGDQMTVSGKIPVGEITYLQNVTPYAVSGLMLNFAEHLQSIAIEKGTITEVSPGYILSSPTEYESGVNELSPVWRICMDGEYWYINALNGKVVSLEEEKNV